MRVIAIIAAVFLVFAADASASNTQTISVAGAPVKHAKVKRSAASIAVLTTTGAVVAGEQIAPATRAQIFFDDDFVFTAAGLPVCRANLNGISAAMARAACPTSIVGTGAGRVALAGFTDTILDAEITAFNGPPQSGHPVIVLHSWTNAVALGTTLVGVLKPYGKSGFGSVLDVTIPALPLNSAIVEFSTRVQRSWKRVIKRKGKRVRITEHYVHARCASRSWKFRGTFTYSGAPANTVSSSQSCTIR